MKLLYERDKEERKKIWEAIKTDKIFRKKYFELDFFAFSVFYFWKNFKTWIKDFHKELYKFLSWDKSWIIIWFRESWKTAICALFYIIWCIAYKKKDFILFMAYDSESATDKVLNVSNFLRWDLQLKNDYWLLFDDLEGKWKDEFNKIKRIDKFISTTWVKVEAVSLKNMKRWKQFLNEKWEIIRPDLLVADDIDIEESVRNIRIIDENEAKILSWVLKSIRWKAIFLWNIIAEDWVIQRLENTFKNHWYTQRISLIEDWKITWAERYVWTKIEADKINKEKFAWEKIVQSIEELSIDKQSFNSDFLNIPRIVIWDNVFNIEALEKLEILSPKNIYTIKLDENVEVDLEVFKSDFSKDFFDYLYVWIDTWGWQGWNSDSSDLCFLDQNWKLYAKVNSNILKYFHISKLLTILNDEYWFEFFDNSLCIERNYLWIALIDEIKRVNPKIYRKLFIPKTEAKKITKYTNIVGWNTTATSKEKMKEDLNQAILQGKISLSEKEAKEFKWWVKSYKGWKIVYEPNGINSKHDDTIIWRGLAFQMFLNNNKDFLWT